MEHISRAISSHLLYNLWSPNWLQELQGQHEQFSRRLSMPWSRVKEPT